MSKLNLKVSESLETSTKQVEEFLVDISTTYEDIEDAIYRLEISTLKNNKWINIWFQSMHDCPDDFAIYSKQIISASEENVKIKKLIAILTNGLIAKREAIISN